MRIVIADISNGSIVLGALLDEESIIVAIAKVEHHHGSEGAGIGIDACSRQGHGIIGIKSFLVVQLRPDSPRAALVDRAPGHNVRRRAAAEMNRVRAAVVRGVVSEILDRHPVHLDHGSAAGGKAGVCLQVPTIENPAGDGNTCLPAS